MISHTMGVATALAKLTLIHLRRAYLAVTITEIAPMCNQDPLTQVNASFFPIWKVVSPTVDHYMPTDPSFGSLGVLP